MNDSWVDAYLARIGAARPARPDGEALRDLHLRHLLAVPFENLSIHLGEDIVLDPEALVAKVVDRRRGGFCYELGGAFGTLLAALGFDVEILAARVFDGDRLGVPYDHLALRVGPWLADVGFGDHAHHPLRLDVRGDQPDPGGVFRIAETPEGDLDVSKDGRPAYRLETRPRALGDFEAGCWWHRTSPKSHFTRSVVCSMLTESGRVTLSGRTLIRTTGGERDERELTGDDEVLAAYRSLFGVELDRVPKVA
ncbi:arylamine N-acetyltransferase family protein [Actinoallomurus iriomotensis]|uniref:N-hydroxyarylamine O-acetyltransferase n=1 Tax=Actinoallomurus iriomotensis TaxID=478107 RepID=A0A9W6S9Q3_9ACTN|nr:arylamine N-acetyltransferase [Actinoallomurus iriomotensis]GLY91031.1 N-hydroxyarylamine O-acetyltransferase [Actinoallomurus iriomotensis]